MDKRGAKAERGTPAPRGVNVNKYVVSDDVVAGSITNNRCGPKVGATKKLANE